MKQRIRRFLGDDKDVDDIWLFKQINKTYQRIDDDDDDDDPAIGSVMSDNDVIYLVEDKFLHESEMFPVYYKGKKVGRIWWKITTETVGRHTLFLSDTVLSLKLRIQEQLGFPVSSVDVKVFGNPLGNDTMMRIYLSNLATDLRIEAL